MNVPLSGGMSAELRDRLTYAQARGLRAAYFAIEKDPVAQADLDLALVVAYVSSWHVLDLDGKAVPLDTPQLAPDDVIQAIAAEAAGLFGLEKVPKENGVGSSPSLSQEPPSEPTIPLSQTSSFSIGTPDGLGLT